jgi:hypothetical protein
MDDSDGPAGPADVLPEVTWARSIGQVGPLAVSDDGNVVIAGAFNGSVSFDSDVLTSAGASDVFVAQLDGNGVVTWTHQFGSTGFDYAFSVAVDRASVYVAGEFSATVDFGKGPVTSSGSTDACLIAFDGQRNVSWVDTFGGSTNEAAYSVDFANGRVALTGEVDSNGVDYGGGPVTAQGNDVFVTTRDAATGGYIDQRGIGGAQSDRDPVVALTAGGLVVSFDTQSDVDAGGGNMPTLGFLDTIVASYAPDGSYRWAKRFGTQDSGSEALPRDVVVDADGNVTVVGFYDFAPDFGGGPLPADSAGAIFIASFDSLGAHRWSRQLVQGQSRARVAVDGAGNIYVATNFTEPLDLGTGPLANAGLNDIVLASFSASGALRWARAYGTAGSDGVEDLAVDTSGQPWLIGMFGESGSIEGTTVQGPFIARLPR